MKPFLFVLVFTFIGKSLSSRAQGNFDVMITGDIPALKQPKGMDCWITVAAMLASWKDVQRYSVEQFATRLGDPWKLYFELNLGLPAKDQEAFIKQMRLREEPAANYSIKAYTRFVQSFGPTWITTGDGLSAHARILIGLRGTGEYGSTQFILIDPASGKITEQESLAFLKEFEEEARVANQEHWEGPRIQIYHY